MSYCQIRCTHTPSSPPPRLEAWNVYFRSILSLYSLLVPDLFAYQAQICKFSRKFKASACLMYNTGFCNMAASNLIMAWGTVNEQLCNDILKEETLPYPTAFIDTPIVTVRWVVPQDSSLISLFAPSHPSPSTYGSPSAVSTPPPRPEHPR